MTTAEKNAKLAADKLAADNAAKQTTPAPIVPIVADAKQEPVYESENLTKLRQQESDLEDKLDKAGNKTPEGKKIRLELWTIGQSIENEITAIKKAQLALEVETRNNKIVAGFWAIFPLWMEVQDLEKSLPPVADRTSENMATYNAKNTELKNLTEPIINRLLGSTPRPATTSGDAKPSGNGGTKGKTTEEIRSLIAPLYATMSGTQIRAFIIKDKGFNDGTANAVILAYEKENRLNGKTPD